MELNSKKIYSYTVILEKEREGGYHAFCPSLPGCHSQGETFEESITNITEAIELYLESLQADNPDKTQRPPPQPAPSAH